MAVGDGETLMSDDNEVGVSTFRFHGRNGIRR